MSVVVTLVTTQWATPAPVTHPTGKQCEVEYGVLQIYSGPAQPVATYAAGSWLSAVIG